MVNTEQLELLVDILESHKPLLVMSFINDDSRLPVIRYRRDDQESRLPAPSASHRWVY